jgi:predicted dithiol-disulfide oxidoreductase (DUF899 family)
MGQSFTWASSHDSDFNFDFGASSSEETTREWIAPMLERGLPPAASQNADATGTDVVVYLSEQPGMSVFCARRRCLKGAKIRVAAHTGLGGSPESGLGGSPESPSSFARRW